MFNPVEHEISMLDKSHLVKLLDELLINRKYQCFCLSNQTFKFDFFIHSQASLRLLRLSKNSVEHGHELYKHGPQFLHLLKTRWEKEKLLVTSNFSFSHSVFHPLGVLCAIFINLKIVV